MVPCLDLANHSREHNAFYDETSGGGAALLLLQPEPASSPPSSTSPGTNPTSGVREITISYGGSKSAAEMLFSYGFIDGDSSHCEMTLRLDPSQDDPLARAKLHAYEGSPTVRLSRTEGSVAWDSPLIHLMVLNEEDGLDFRVQQDTAGNRQLQVFWQEENVTFRAAEFEKLTQDHPLRPIFRLRAVAMVQERVMEQLARIQDSHVAETPMLSDASPEPRADHIRAAKLLRETETLLLKDAVASLDDQVGCMTRAN